MYLSRLTLNPRSRAARRDLADCQALHRTIMAGFTDLGDVGEVRARLGVLYRLDVHPRTAVPTVLVQSRQGPSWSRFEPGYLLDTGGEPANPAVKPIHEAYANLRAGLVLAFRLRANPTKKIDTRSGPDGQRRNGKRVELRGEADQTAWLRRKAELGGFALVAVRASPDVANLRGSPEAKLVGRRPEQDGGSRRLTFGSVLFEGELRVTDADLFRSTLEQGIGSGKAYGFGLLSIKRPG